MPQQLTSARCVNERELGSNCEMLGDGWKCDDSKRTSPARRWNG